MTLAEIRSKLGDPAKFIPNEDARDLLKQFAIAIGLTEVEVNARTLVDLTNLYHDRCPKPVDPTALQVACANMLISLLRVMPDKIVLPRIDTNGLTHYATDIVKHAVMLAHPVMLVGPAGCGKTTIGETIARMLNFPFYISSSIGEAHELTGFIDGYGKYHRTPFREAFENGGVWIADEIDAWDASALLTANSALANGMSVFPDAPLPIGRHANFRMIATANTFGNGADRVYIGRNELDAASLDRFATITVDYDLNLERMFANGNVDWLERVWQIRKIVNEKKIRHVVSSRAIIMGSQALASGMKRSDVENIYLFKGMSKKDRDKIDD